MYAYVKDNNISFLSFSLVPSQDEHEVIEYNNSITDPVYEDGQIIQSPHIESDYEKKIRVIQAIVSAESLEWVDTEWALFSDQDIGEIILQRVFNGNKFWESALQGKISAYILSLLQNEPNTALFSEIADKQAQVNEVRVFFWLTPIV